jgi:hypothetical protein
MRIWRRADKTKRLHAVARPRGTHKTWQQRGAPAGVFQHADETAGIGPG